MDWVEAVAFFVGLFMTPRALQLPNWFIFSFDELRVYWKEVGYLAIWATAWTIVYIVR